MNFEYFIAHGMWRGEGLRRRNIMVRIGVGSTALGVAVMIVVLAVLSGFGRGIGERLTGFSGHVRVTDFGTGFGDAGSAVFERDTVAERLFRNGAGFVSWDSYVQKEGLIRREGVVEGLALKGYDGNGGAFFERCLVEGSMPRSGDPVRYKDILLSRATASRLDVSVGDRIEMLFMEEGRAPRRDRFAVSGLYASGMDEGDRLTALTDVRNVRRLAEASEHEVSGYEIRLDRLSRAGEYAEALNRSLLYDESIESSLAAESIQTIYPAIFDWQKTHDVNAAVLIVLMLAVALFNMTGAMLILVLERTRTVGVLKALGMSDASLRRMFLYRGARIVAEGVLWGDAAGLALCLVQSLFHVVRLDPSGYILSEMPVHVEWWHVAAVDAGAVAVIVLGLMIPVRIVSSVRPDEAVRYE